MLTTFTKENRYITDSSLVKILLSWKFQFLIICFLIFLLILFFCWRYYIKNLSVKKDVIQKSGKDDQRPIKQITVDTVRKIPLQRSAVKRRILTSKPHKTKNNKSPTLSPSKTNQVVFQRMMFKNS